MVVEVNRDSFEKEVIETKQPVMVDFWGPQCRPCLALMPLVEKLEKKYTGRLKVTKVNAVENRMLCAKLRVLGLPMVCHRLIVFLLSHFRDRCYTKILLMAKILH